jgi:hypothetical protein
LSSGSTGIRKFKAEGLDGHFVTLQGFVGHREEKQASPFADWELREKLSRRITPRQRQSRDPEANSSEQAA